MGRARLAVIVGALVAITVVAAGTVSMLTGPTSVAPESSTGASPPSSGAASVDGIPVAWAFVSLLPPDDERPAYALQAGWLGEDGPRIDIEVPWDVDPLVDLGRSPVAADPAAGAVVYVAEARGSSIVHRRALAEPDEEETLAMLDDVVQDLVVAPDGSTAYLALEGRGQRREDHGVVRLALDGSGMVEPLLAPARAAAGPIRSIAVAVPTVGLGISPDGRYLVRMACDGAWACRTDVVDLVSGNRADIGPDRVHDIGPGGVLLVERCRQDGGCDVRLIDPPTGVTHDMSGHPFDTGLVSDGDRVLVVEIRPRASAFLIDPRTGDERPIYVAPDGAMLGLTVRHGLQWSVPAGAALLTEAWERPGPNGTMTLEESVLLVPIDGSAVRRFPAPSIRDVDGGPMIQG